VGFGSLVFFNGSLDKSMFLSHDVVVIKKYYVKNKNGRTYYATVNSWRMDRTSEKIKIS